MCVSNMSYFKELDVIIMPIFYVIADELISFLKDIHMSKLQNRLSTRAIVQYTAMARLVKWCLYILYFIGRTTGLINFEVDLKTGRPKVTKRATTCAVCLQILILISVTYQLIKTEFFSMSLKNANALHEYASLFVECSRLICVIVALVSRWTHRRNYIRLYNSFRRLFQNHPEIVQYCQRSIIIKCLCVKISEIIQVVAIYYLITNNPTINGCIGIWNMMSITLIVNGVATQFFIAMASLRGRYIHLNKDLKALLSETQALNPCKSGVFMTTCCSLADRFEEISNSQSELQALIKWLLRTYQVEVVITTIISYLNLVGNLYVLFIFRANVSWIINLPKNVAVYFTLCTAYYFIDYLLNMYNIFYVLEAHEEMVQLLSQRTLFKQGLDQRLEAVVSQKEHQ